MGDTVPPDDCHVIDCQNANIMTSFSEIALAAFLLTRKKGKTHVFVNRPEFFHQKEK